MIKLAQLLLEQKMDVVKDDWSKGLENPVVTLSNGKSYELELVDKEFEDGNYMYFFDTPELPGYEFVTIGHEDDPTYVDGWEVNVYPSRLPKDIPGFEGTRDALDNLSIRESKDFDLKKFLIENRLTSNGKRLYENRERVKVTKNEFPYIEFTDGSKNYQVEFDYYDEIDDHGYQVDVLYAGKDQFGDGWTIEAVEDKMSGDVDDYDLGSIERM